MRSTFCIVNVCVDVSLQKFKLNIANTVISQDNSSLQAMNTSDLLDLFQISGTSNHRGNKKVGLEAREISSAITCTRMVLAGDVLANCSEIARLLVNCHSSL